MHKTYAYQTCMCIPNMHVYKYTLCVCLIMGVYTYTVCIYCIDLIIINLLLLSLWYIVIRFGTANKTYLLTLHLMAFPSTTIE